MIDAPGKVNLTLFLGPTRARDGRHELVTVYQSLTLADQLAVEFDVEADEVVCPGVEGPNLALDALHALRRAGWTAPPVRITIEKRIPVAAGMAGGSADAAAVLRLADLPDAQLYSLAARLGADVPGQLQPGLSLGVGAGEIVTPLPLLGEHAYVVVPSEHQLATPDVFAEADRLGLGRSSEDLAGFEKLVRNVVVGGKSFPDGLILNDLQPAALSLCPSIATSLEALIDAGAEQAIVSGSGPTTVGIWWGEGARAAAETAATSLCADFRRAEAALPYASSAQSGATA